MYHNFPCDDEGLNGEQEVTSVFVRRAERFWLIVLEILCFLKGFQMNGH